ncbi:MAG TPA: hypothetical protein VE262_12795 [Blastocatellia bacterium]|nr:hypothetical protein [Blastocatellia bacterium]
MARLSNKRLYRLFAAALFMTALARAPIALAQQPAGGGMAPKVVVSQTSYDFGNVFRGEGISYVFVIKNEGKADLVIEEFTPS